MYSIYISIINTQDEDWRLPLSFLEENLGGSTGRQAKRMPAYEEERSTEKPEVATLVPGYKPSFARVCPECLIVTR